MVAWTLSTIIFFVISNQVEASKPLIWNTTMLEIVRSNTAYKTTFEKNLRAADKICNVDPVVVTDKVNCRVDKHYYYQTSGYFWLSGSSDSAYVYKDGYRNPDSYDYDFYRLKEMIRRLKFLSVAYYLSDDEKYYGAYIKQLNAWFIEKSTYMYPNFKYAGFVSDQNEKGARGLAQAYVFIDLLESLRLVNDSKKIDIKTYRAIQKWFKTYIENLDADYGCSIKKVKNNIGSGYDITLVYLYLFVGEKKKAKQLADQFADKWLYKQIKENGEQPAELRREAAFSYSVYNLAHIIDFCFLYRYWGRDFYHENQERIDSAFSFLEQFAKNPSSFPYKQVSGWDDKIRNFNRQMDRLERLRSRNDSIGPKLSRPLSVYEIIE